MTMFSRGQHRANIEVIVRRHNDDDAERPSAPP